MSEGEYSSEKFQHFTELHKKLVRNRQQVPLEVLQTKYAKGYGKMVDELNELADWWARCYFQELRFQTHPKDTAGNEWLVRKIATIKAQEEKPGGLVEQYHKVLIDDLDMDEYFNTVWKIYDRMDKEAYDPYIQRHNRWIGPPDNRWIYNDVFNAYWKTDPKFNDGGFWINQSGEFARLGNPPKIKPDDGGTKK